MRRVISLAVVPLILISMAANTWAEQPIRTITTNGQAIVYVKPDEAVVTFGVETFDRSLDKAKTQNDAQSETLVKAIKGLGIDAKYIQTDNLNIQLRYINGQPWHGIEGYLADRAYSVTLKDTTLFEKLIDTALKNGANQMAGFEFRSSELRKHRDHARSMAAKAAKEKAVALAAELECGVGKPQQISESGGGYFGGYNLRFGGNAMMNAQNSIQAAPAGGEEGGALPLGQIAIQADVNVVFELTDKPDLAK